MVKPNKESTTSVGNISPLTDYVDGITTYYLAPQYGRSYPVRRDGDMVSVILDDDAYAPGEEGGEGEEGDTSTDSPLTSKKIAPTLMDVELVSNEVVYDPNTGIPSAKVVFKIRNSTGGPIKNVNYRVSIV